MWKPIVYLLILLLSSTALFGQASYTGFIGKYPVELVADIYSDGDARAIYVYTNFDEPIAINGKLQDDRLILYEKDGNGKNKAMLSFEHFHADARELKGYWADLRTGKQLEIRLSKAFALDDRNEAEWKDRELI